MNGQGKLSIFGSLRAVCLLPALFLSVVLALVVLPNVASADYTYRGVVLSMSQVDSPQRIAVEQSTGNAFVVDETHGRVSVTRPVGLTGELLTTFGSGILQKPFGIAIDESGPQTRIYVSDAGLNEIVRFVSDGQPTPSFTLDATYSSPAQGTEADEIQSFASPLALAPNGDLWVADRGANVVKRFDDEGSHVPGSNFDGSDTPEGDFDGLLDIAANSEGDLYIVDANGEIKKGEGISRVQRFASTGAYKATIGPLGPRSRSAIVAVNPADDSIVVSGDQDGVLHNESAPYLYRFDSEDSFLEEFRLNGDFIQAGSARGLAFHPGERDRIYAAYGRTFFMGAETGGLPGLHVASERFPPAVTIDPAAGVGPTKATISGSVNARNLETEWEVKYRPVGTGAWIASGAASAGDGATAIPVQQQLEGLRPATEYEALIVASSSDGSSETAVVKFTTESSRPRVAGQSAEAGATDVKLRARILPGGAETTYYFEYGTSPAYGEQTATGVIPAQVKGVNVTAEVGGLTPNATYHFRVVAENENGSARGEDRTFVTRDGQPDTCPNAKYRTGAAVHLTDCRAYELVTPPGTGGLRIGGAPTTPDGSVACFNTEYQLLDSDPNGIKLGDDGFCSWREEGRWRTEWVTGPRQYEQRFTAMGSNVYYLAPDAERVVFSSDAFLLSRDYLSPVPSATTQMRSYMWEDGTLRELTPPRPLVIPGVGEFFLPEQTALERRALAASEDLTHGVFQSTNNLVPEDFNSVSDVYEWTPEGIRLVSRDASGTAVTGQVPQAPGETLQTQFRNLISRDGSRIFFQHKGVRLDEGASPSEEPETAFNVYMREGDEVTLVSPRRGSGPAQDALFVGASEDGGTVYVSTSQQLTDEPKHPGQAIYRYRVSSDSLKLVATRPGGVTMLDVSDDGSTVVYRAISNNQAFVLRDGETELLGRLSDADVGQPFRLGSRRFDQRALRITADGDVIVFAAAGEFAGADGDGPVQIYRWEAGEGVENISAAAGEPTEDASIGAYASPELGSPRGEVLHQHRYKAMEGRIMSDDGSRVFFETPEALVDRDVNGEIDVYEWHDDNVRLVTSGTGGASFYHDNSADGKTVFFTTFQRLLPAVDTNVSRDLYVARPNGGLDAPPTSSTCEGEACQSHRPAPAALRQTDGGGNVAAALQVKPLTKGQLRALAGGKRTVLKVTVGESGRVTATLRGPIGKRAAVVAKGSKQVSTERPRSVGIPLKLSGAARRALARKGKLRLKLTVRHSGSGSVVSQGVVLRG